MKKYKYPVLEKKFSEKKLVYLDAACTYLHNSDFIESHTRYYKEYSSCAGDRESSYIGSLLTEEIHYIRNSLKEFLGANSSDFIVFTSSTTDSINLLALSIAETIEVFFVSDLEHNSNYLPWYNAAQISGKECIMLPFQDILDIKKFERICKAIKSPFMLSLTHASNILGGIFDISQIAEIVHKYGGYLFIDDAQYIVHHDEDVKENSIDFLAFSGHKIGGPTGIGVLYIKESCANLISRSGRIGGGTVRNIRNGVPEYKNLPEFFEGGVQNFASILSLGGVISERSEWEKDLPQAIIKNLMDYFYGQFEEYGFHKFMKIISFREGSIVTICPLTFHAIDFHQYCNYFLNDYIIAFRTGSFCVDNYVNTYLGGEKNIMRFSFGIYNTKNDIDILFHSITQYLCLAKK